MCALGIPRRHKRVQVVGKRVWRNKIIVSMDVVFNEYFFSYVGIEARTPTYFDLTSGTQIKVKHNNNLDVGSDNV